MALMDKLSKAFVDTWYKSPEAAVIEQDGLVEDAFVSTVSDVAPSGDTFIADSVVKTTASQYAMVGDYSQEKIYNHDEYTGDGYEDLSDPSFAVSSNVEMEEEVVAQTSSKIESVQNSPKVYAQPSPMKTSAFANFDLGSTSAFRPKASAINIDYDTKPTQTINVKPQQPRTATMSGTSEENRIKAAVGFNTGFATTQPTSSFTSSRLATGGRNMVAEKVAVQVLTPNKVEDVGEACAYLKEGSVVMAVLSGIADKTARMRYLDYLCGCCKGCDADFKEVVSVESSDCVLIAAPRGVGIKTPAVRSQVEEQAQKAEAYHAGQQSNNGSFGSEFSLNFASDATKNY